MTKLFGVAMAMLLMGQAAPPAGIADLGWMSGSWARMEDGRWTEEHWAEPRGGMMIGYSRSGHGESAREFEFLLIRADQDGVPVYWAAPGGRTPVRFRLAEIGENEATFANLDHDFPQRIAYRREGDSLTATISLADGSRSMRWTYRGTR